MYITALSSALWIAVAFSPEYAGQNRNPDPPVLYCPVSSDQECAYTIHDANGSTNLVLRGGQSHGYNVNMIGAAYCVNYGLPPQRTPSWPSCFNNPAPFGHVYIHAGQN